MTRARDLSPVLVTGGAGFVGTNLAHRLASEGRQVIVYDDLSRAGVEDNLRWLTDTHGNAIEVVIADVRDFKRLRRAVAQARSIYHLAAQVAVTSSLVDPCRDFEVNVGGTFNLLEAARAAGSAESVVFTSTNKVYGLLPEIPLLEQKRRYAARGRAEIGVDETQPLDFHSPYGCSKGAADQYVLDFARNYGLPATVFRMSCIYGPHQHGTEDQGWVAHFALRAAAALPITIYGDGKQIRDLLFVGDLVDAFLLAERHMPAIAGEAFNIGGGPENAVSLLELLDFLGEHYRRPPLSFGPWRAGDQRFYVSNTAKFSQATGWRPRIDVAGGLDRLCAWLAKAGRTQSSPDLRQVVS
jgi:CDP-paratose 2-epimerase